MNTEHVRRMTEDRKNAFISKARSFFSCVATPDVVRNKGYYGVIYAKPSRRIAANLGASRELLVLVSTFKEQQARTMESIEHHIRASGGRLESKIAIVVHEDREGHLKLRNWGRERGVIVLPILGEALMQADFNIGSYLAQELYAYDPFDVTGPVCDDNNFFGRRDEALDLARKLQSGSIRACLGIRKAGKTSVLNRVIQNLKEHHDCHTIFVDCSKDAIWSTSALSLICWLASAAKATIDAGSPYLPLDSHRQPTDRNDMNGAVSLFQAAIAASTKPMVLVFDEIDYITPGSTTAADSWTDGFNVFWRNLRGVYQETTRMGKKLSVLVAGVSSKWFFVGRIGSVENAALAFIPEEYLSPLPRGATEAMIKNLAKRAGLQLEAAALAELAMATGDMPYWSRKLCSYIHRHCPIEGRPRNLDLDTVKHFIGKFMAEEGGTLARVALSHLFAVYPELRKGASLCFTGKGNECPAHLAGPLSRYGVIRDSRQVAGSMMDLGLRLTLSADAEDDHVAGTAPAEPSLKEDLGEWAEELASVGKRRNLLERRLRVVVANLMRYDSLEHKDKPAAKARVLSSVNEKRRKDIEHLALDDMMDKLFWPELIAVVVREWPLFERVFGDRSNFKQSADIINGRPDAHAKKYDQAEFALYRRALVSIEDGLRSID